MIQETLAALIGWALLTALGFGPAVWLLKPNAVRLWHILALAPALGFALLSILAFPFYRFFAPVQVWAIPLTVLGIIGSAFLTWRELRSRSLWDEWRGNQRDVMLLFGFGVGATFLLALPMLAQGIQYSIFRANSSDAMYYIAHIETGRVVPWNILQAGAEMNRANWDGMAQAARVSPATLFIARFNSPFTQINGQLVGAWLGEVTGLPSYRVYFSFHLLCFVLAGLAVFALSELLGMSRRLALLGALAVSGGFWAHFILETDAQGEITALSVVLLSVIAWAHAEKFPTRIFSRARLFHATAFAAICCLYIPVVPLVVFAMIVYAAISLVWRTQPFKTLFYPLATALLTILVLTITLQIDNIIRVLRFMFSSSIDAQDLNTPQLLIALSGDPFPTFWGLPRDLLYKLPPFWHGRIWEFAFFLLAILVTVLALLGIRLALRKNAPSARRIVLSMFAAGVFIALVMLWRGNEKNAGRALSYIYPYVILLGLTGATWQAPLRQKWFQYAALATVTLWVVTQLFAATALAFRPPPKTIFQRGSAKTYQFNVAPIENYLRAHPPQQLAVNVPRAKTFDFAFYISLVTAPYQPYFLSGLVVDNQLGSQNLWFGELERAPDYALILKQDDWVGAENLGTRVAETTDLILYRITTRELAPFRVHEQILRDADQTKTFLESTPR